MKQVFLPRWSRIAALGVAGACVGLASCARDFPADRSKVSKQQGRFTSMSGYSVKNVPGHGEGVYNALIYKKGSVVGALPNARAESFSPVGDVLLVHQAMAHDDTRYYLALITEGGVLKGKTIGDRFSHSAKWSEDGTTLTLKGSKLAGTSDETIDVTAYGFR